VREASTERSGLVLRPGVAEDAPACAAIFNAWVDETGWMPRVHDAADVGRFYREHIMATCDVVVAEEEGRTLGFVAVDGEGFVASFYLSPPARGRGIGRALLDAAKRLRPEGLVLWAFVANRGARRFYAREGFLEVARTPGENEEGLPDVMLRWKP
jgi:GNAT superfamily N-acetyltransferase